MNTLKQIVIFVSMLFVLTFHENNVTYGMSSIEKDDCFQESNYKNQKSCGAVYEYREDSENLTRKLPSARSMENLQLLTYVDGDDYSYESDNEIIDAVFLSTKETYESSFCSNDRHLYQLQKNRLTRSSVTVPMDCDDFTNAFKLQKNESIKSQDNPLMVSVDNSSIKLVEHKKKRRQTYVQPYEQTFNKHKINRPLSRPTTIILSIDGGGARGIIPLSILNLLHNEIGDKLPIDVFAGTSVGALVAVSEILGKTHEVCEKFPTIAKEIFTRSKLNKWTFGLFGAKYVSNKKQNIIEEIINGQSNDNENQTIEQFIQGQNQRLFIPMYSYNTRENIIYDSNDPILPLSDALMGTTAAPTYFYSHNCETSDGRQLALIDGGIWQNNPTLIAYVETKKAYPDNYIKIISLGTGFNNRISGVNSVPKHLLQWGMEISDVTMEASAQGVNMNMIEMCNMDPLLENLRIQINLDSNSCSLDRVEPVHLTNLKNSAISTVTNQAVAPLQYNTFERIKEILREETLKRKS